MSSNHDLLISQLGRHGILSGAAQAAIRRVPTTRKAFERGSYIVREADAPRVCVMLLSGYAIRHKVTGQGARQIVAICIPGEVVDLQNLYLDIADHSVQMITDGEASTFDRRSFQNSAAAEAEIARAVMLETLIDGSIMREWLTNNGQRSAKVRIAHLVCELCVRLSKAIPSGSSGFDLPINQEGLGDALGLTSAHVNRMIKELTDEGLLTWNKGVGFVPDWAQLREKADFNSQYLHLDQLK